MDWDRLLSINYHEFDEETKDLCIDRLVNFIQNNPKVNHDPHMIRKITKIGYRILETTDKLDDYVDRLYDYNVEGINLSYKHHLTAHFHASAADLLIYYKNNEPLTKIAYHCKSAGQLVEENDSFFAALSYRNAARALKRYFTATNNITFGIESYELFLKSSKLDENTDDKMKRILAAGMIMADIYDISKNPDHSKLANTALIEANKLTLQLAKKSRSFYARVYKANMKLAEFNTDDNLKLRYYFKASIAAKHLAYKNPSWTDTWYRTALLSDMYKKSIQKHLYYNISRAARQSYFCETKKKYKWLFLQKWQKFAELSLNGSNSYYNAGLAAQTMGDWIKSKYVYDKAARYFQKSIDLSTNHHKHNQIAEKRIKQIKQKSHSR